MICFPKREKSFPIRCLAVLGFKNEVPLLSSHLEHDSNSWKCYDYVVVKMVVGGGGGRRGVQFAFTLNHNTADSTIVSIHGA